MLTLVTGLPGAGKTWYCVREIKQLVEKGRLVYSDIEGLNIEGVRPMPERWQDMEPGSIGYLDECQRSFGPDRKTGRTDAQHIADLETHRHRGIDLVLITQHPSLLHAHVRRLIGEHKHVVSVYGSSLLRVYSGAEILPVDKPKALLTYDTTSLSRTKDVFELYDSTVLNTHRARVPKKTAMMGAFFVLLVVVLAFAIPWTFENFMAKVARMDHIEAEKIDPDRPMTFAEIDERFRRLGKQLEDEDFSEEDFKRFLDSLPEHPELPVETIEPKDIPPGKPDLKPQSKPKKPERRAIAGCMSLGDTCRCLDADGGELAVTVLECEHHLGMVALPSRSIREDPVTIAQPNRTASRQSGILPGQFQSLLGAARP